MEKNIIILLAQELYHELHTLDRFEQDYQRKHQEEVVLHAGRRGEILASSLTTFLLHMLQLFCSSLCN